MKHLPVVYIYVFQMQRAIFFLVNYFSLYIEKINVLLLSSFNFFLVLAYQPLFLRQWQLGIKNKGRKKIFFKYTRLKKSFFLGRDAKKKFLSGKLKKMRLFSMYFQSLGLFRLFFKMMQQKTTFFSMKILKYNLYRFSKCEKYN